MSVPKPALMVPASKLAGPTVLCANHATRSLAVIGWYLPAGSVICATRLPPNIMSRSAAFIRVAESTLMANAFRHSANMMSCSTI